MIKVLKLSNKSVTRFNTNKKWNYSTLDSGSNIILEQGEDIPLFSSTTNKLSTEQNNSEFKLNMRVGKKVTGTFFSKDSKHFNSKNEPLNYDGSYQRVVYNSVKHLFYNDYGTVGDVEHDQHYKNPMNIFGSETGIYSPQNFNSNTIEVDKRSERRILKDEVTVLEIPTGVFGEKIKPGTLKITDHSSEYESIEIIDDGNTNLVVGSDTFNSISELNLNSFFSSISETSSTDSKVNVDYTDLSYGFTVDSHGDFLLTGAPILPSSPSENQAGRASLHKFNPTSKQHELVKNFYCPFTQNGIAQENRNDNCQFIITELDNVISTEDFLVNDNFGKSVSINETICAIGSPLSHINGRNNDQPTGHVFIYEKNKGGKENWGIINVFEGTPDSEFGESISIDNDFIAIGSPNFDNGTGCVYLFKKTKRTKEHPWIKTSSVYDSYKWDDVLSKYEGIPNQNTNKYSKYLKERDRIVSQRISKTIKELKKLREVGTISDIEYIQNIPTKDDYSEVFPYNYLYTDNDQDCDNESINWYNQKIWSKHTHPATRCQYSESEKHYKKSIWPGYMTDEKTDLYLPNPDHEQNKDNKWAYRWKIQNIEGGAESIHLFGDENECDSEELSMFSDMSLNSFGDGSGFPLTEYSETPKESIGDTTFDLVGTIKSPDLSSKRFGEKVVIKGNKLYASTYSTNLPRCYMFTKTTNQHGCEVWELKNTISETELVGHTSESYIDENAFKSAEINHYDTYFDIKVCPNIQTETTSVGELGYDKWIYSFDQPILNSEFKIQSGVRVDRCDSICKDFNTYEYYSRFNKINLNQSAQIPANYGESINLPMLDTSAKFFSKSELADSFYHPSENSTGVSWKNARENVSFAYTNVEPGTFPNFMTIYSNDAKQDDGTYDPLHTLIEIGAQETLNNKSVRLIINSGTGDTEHFYEFLYRGSIEGTHYTLNELKQSLDFECTLPPNRGHYEIISNENFVDSLGNKSNAKLFYNKESDSMYSEPWTSDDTLSIGWKNFRENVSFSYPLVVKGKHTSIMKVYSNNAKNSDGSYNPLNILAEIHAQETLDGETVRLTFNTGFTNNVEYHYDFIYRGSTIGTQYTLNELKTSLDYSCTLPPNQGEYIEIIEDRFTDPLGSKLPAQLFSKGKTTPSYIQPWCGEDAIGLSWKNFRENVSFSYPNVNRGKLPSFMAIYANEAKQEDGSYDPRYILAEIGAQETLNREVVRLTFNTGFVGGDEYYYEFMYRGSIEGTHYTLNELKQSLEFDCTLPANLGGYISISDREFSDPLDNKSRAKFFSKNEDGVSYAEPWVGEGVIDISWKNFRENVSFSYPSVKKGNVPSVMTIYGNGAVQPDGTYNPLYILAEIGAQETLNGELVRLTFNSGFVGGEEYYYDFIYHGSLDGTHYTINELRESVEFECTLPSNQGTSVSLSEIKFDDYLLNSSGAKFFTKNKNQSSYKHNPHMDEISISWKNFRENVSFSYPSVSSGSEPSFMTIYANGARDKNGNYDPIKTLAEIGAEDSLNEHTVRLTFNYGSETDDEFYYEFIYNGSLNGTHYTLSELMEHGLLKRVESTTPLQKNKSDKNNRFYVEKLKSEVVNQVEPHDVNPISSSTSTEIKKIKSFGKLPINYGHRDTYDIQLTDDILQSSNQITFYSMSELGEPHTQHSGLEDEISLGWRNFRESVSFYYPTISKKSSDVDEYHMSIYMNHNTENGYDKNRLLAEVKSNSALNGETVRLVLNEGDSTEIFYEFLFDGTLEGTHYTITELNENISPNLNKPLIVHSPELENCKVRIDKNQLTSGLHKLYILLLDSSNQPIGGESKIEMYNNPIIYDVETRKNLVKKSYTYSTDIKSKFGKGMDASDKFLVIGNPVDRKYYTDHRTSYTAGSAYVFKVNEQNLDFIEKIYGEDNFENEFSSEFGNDISVLGSNFLVGSHSTEMTNININESGGVKKLDIEDLEFGATKYLDKTYNTNEALITDYELDLNSEIGDAVVKVKIDGLNINKSLLSETTLKANFIDTGYETLRISDVEGELTESINGVYRLVKSPINVVSGCDIDLNSMNRVYMNKHNWSVFYDKLRSCWVLTDKPNISVEYEIPCSWGTTLEVFERINLISEFNLLTEEMMTSAFTLYNISDHDTITKWKTRTQTRIPKIQIRYADLIRELESITKLELNEELTEELFYLYSSNSRKRIDIEILNRWKDSDSNLGMLPFIYELDSVNPIFLNFNLLVKTLDIYKLKDYEILKSWSVKLGYEHLLGDLLREIRPSYHDKLSLYNLRVLSKIALDFINQRKYNSLPSVENQCPDDENFDLTEEELVSYRQKWKPHVDGGFLLSDVFKDINKNININFALSSESSEDELPMNFKSGIGTLGGKVVNVYSNNDTTGQTSSLTWGIYRDETKIVGNHIHFYINLLPDTELDSTLVFVYNSVKSAINGYVYYYSIDKTNNKCNKLKRMKTNKTSYSCKKQYGHSVSLSKNFISVGSPVLGNFNIDEITTFGGRSVVSFGESDKLFIEYDMIHPTYINQLSKKVVGSIIAYDHSAIRDNKRHYIGNIFYKNGIIALTDRSGYFSDVLSNSGVSGFELEFKSMHTLYENEILCKVEPHEFNFSTNPTSVATGSIAYDINQDGKFDIIDASYIFKYIMGEVGDIEITDDEIIENETSIKLSDKNNWPKQDILMTESEDALLMDLFFSSDVIENRPVHDKIVSNLKEKYDNGEFDINGDGKTDEVDANLLLRYFIGRRGAYLTRDLVSKYNDSSRTDSNSIVKFLDEKTGKNLGREILKDFQDFSENDKQDSTGSYLAPYATTIGLYSGLELAMVAKLGKPVKILPNYPINFLIKFDN